VIDTSSPPQSAHSTKTLHKIIAFSVCACVLLQLHLQFVQKLNWDEFHFLSQVYSFTKGNLSVPLQTLHVHLFDWLTRLGQDEIRTIEIARVFMWLFQLGTLVLIYLTSRHFCSKSASLIGVLAYLASGYVLIHGTSFRPDPMGVFLSMVGIYILTCSRLSVPSLIILACTMAIGAMITIKVALFAPLLIWLAWWQILKSDKYIEPIIRLLLTGALFLTVGYIIYRLHLHQLKPIPSESSNVLNELANISKTTIFSSGLFPRADYIKESIFLSIPQCILLALGVMHCVYVVKKDAVNRVSALILLGFLLPLLSLLFYRNAFPYFFPFIMAPSAVLLSFGAVLLEKKQIFTTGALLLLFCNFFLSYLNRLPENQSVQQDTINLVRTAFPTQVNYIDRCSMVSSSNKLGHFMSSWGHSNYLKKGEASLLNIAKANTIPVVIANTPYLRLALEHGFTPQYQALLEEDANFLKHNYIHHWGDVWVAGKYIPASKSPAQISTVVPGDYTIESQSTVVIDGEEYLPGNTVSLTKQTKSILSPSGAPIILRWGDNLYRPIKVASRRPIFTSF